MIREKIRVKLKRLNKSIYKLAQETGVDKSSIINFLNNKRGMSVTNIEKLLKNLKLVLKDR